uniref:Uncharacterized protein n=1 Tax=Romanomermis culicivorax TaxID=13658 RepID=A0A915I6S1_ROMCU
MIDGRLNVNNTKHVSIYNTNKFVQCEFALLLRKITSLFRLVDDGPKIFYDLKTWNTILITLGRGGVCNAFRNDELDRSFYSFVV